MVATHKPTVSFLNLVSTMQHVATHMTAAEIALPLSLAPVGVSPRNHVMICQLAVLIMIVRPDFVTITNAHQVKFGVPLKMLVLPFHHVVHLTTTVATV